MYRIAIPALLFAVLASANAEASGLHLNSAVVKFTSKVPVIDNFVSSKGVTLPVLGKLPGLSLLLGSRVVLLGNVNIDDLQNGVDVGHSGTQYAGQLSRQLQTELKLLKN